MRFDKGKLIIYWDYELQRGPDTSNLHIKKSGIDDYRQTNFILDFLKKTEIKCCFVVLGMSAEKGNLPYHAPDQIRKMAELGHEVGSHTYDHKRLSNISYDSLLKDLIVSKRLIEKASRTPCVSFVPPWDKPQYLFSLSLRGIDLKNRFRGISLSKLSYSDFCSALKKAGYQTYRICPFGVINKIKLSKPVFYNEVLCVPSIINNGFTEKHKLLVKKAIRNKGLAVVYGHPLGLKENGPQNKRHFVDFIKYVTKQVKNKKLDVIVPFDLVKYEH